MSTEAPFNAELATARWVDKFDSKTAFTNQDLFEMCRDILQIHLGDNWQSSSITLGEEDTPRTIGLECVISKKPPLEYIHVSVEQEDFPLEEFMVRYHKGSNRFSTYWKDSSHIQSSLLGYILAPDLENWVRITLKPEESIKIAKQIWDAHSYNLVRPDLAGDEAILEVHYVDPQSFLSLN